jgi:2-polyprenyl-3-methyl-5-hydroxy-6-metoxy-1,4-benzoquinol methylase
LTFEWSDPPDYLEALTEFLSPLRETCFWNSSWYAHTDLAHFNFVVSHLRRHTSIEGASVLDTGCGTAGLLIALSKLGAAELVGIEIDTNVFRLAGARTRTLPNIRIIQADAQIAALEKQSFDIVISHHVIEHVDRHERYIQALCQLVKPGAILFIACPNRLWPIEAHSNLPLIHYLPRSVAKKIGRRLESAAMLPAQLRDRGRTSTLYESDFTYFRLKRLLKRNRFEILEFNDPRDFMTSVSVGALVNIVAKCPVGLQQYFAKLFSKDLYAVCRRTSDQTIPDGFPEL